MKLPNGYGSVVKLSGKRRKPYIVRKTVGWHYDKEKDKQVQEMITIGYTATKAEGLLMLADYNNNPFDTKAAMNPALNVNIYFIQKMESILNTEITMIAISSH